MDKQDKIIKEKIRSLDQQLPSVSWSEDELWSQISQGEKRRRFPLKWSVAASIALLIAVGSYFFVSESSDAPYLSYSTENGELSAGLNIAIDESGMEAMDFIKSECLHLAEICKSQEFQSLTDELIVLESEMLEINEMIKKYGEDPDFISSKVQVEGLMSEITNQLIQMVLS